MERKAHSSKERVGKIACLPGGVAHEKGTPQACQPITKQRSQETNADDMGVITTQGCYSMLFNTSSLQQKL